MMALIEGDLFRGSIDKVQIAIDLLHKHEPLEGYYLAFSGGKDSITIKRLADMAAVRYVAVYNVTTIDPPELVWFIKQHHHDVIFDKPKKPLLYRMIDKGSPSANRRWCCQEYKERGGSGCVVITGVRWAESVRRRRRKQLETCYRDHSKTYLNIIIDWTDAEVWEFIKQEKLPYCSLYDEGFKRIGCVMCPLSTTGRIIDANRWPRYKIMWQRAFDRLYEIKKQKGIRLHWSSGEDMFHWWLYSQSKINPDQLVMFE